MIRRREARIATPEVILAELIKQNPTEVITDPALREETSRILRSFILVFREHNRETETFNLFGLRETNRWISSISNINEESTDRSILREIINACDFERENRHKKRLKTMSILICVFFGIGFVLSVIVLGLSATKYNPHHLKNIMEVISSISMSISASISTGVVLKFVRYNNRREREINTMMCEIINQLIYADQIRTDQ